MDVWNSIELELMRDEARKKLGRISFDCYNLKLSPCFKGKRVYCAKGHPLGRAKDGTLDLMFVLRGMLAGACKECGDYDGGNDE